MKQILGDIQSGKFADEWITEYQLRHAALPRAAEGSRASPDRRGRRASCAALMPWLGVESPRRQVEELTAGMRIAA